MFSLSINLIFSIWAVCPPVCFLSASTAARCPCPVATPRRPACCWWGSFTLWCRTWVPCPTACASTWSWRTMMTVTHTRPTIPRTYSHLSTTYLSVFSSGLQVWDVPTDTHNLSCLFSVSVSCSHSSGLSAARLQGGWREQLDVWDRAGETHDGWGDDSVPHSEAGHGHRETETGAGECQGVFEKSRLCSVRVGAHSLHVFTGWINKLQLLLRASLWSLLNVCRWRRAFVWRTRGFWVWRKTATCRRSVHRQHAHVKSAGCGRRYHRKHPSHIVTSQVKWEMLKYWTWMWGCRSHDCVSVLMLSSCLLISRVMWPKTGRRLQTPTRTWRMMVNLPPVTLVLCVTSRFHRVRVSGGQVCQS